ncbi:MAG: hypothetical protein JSR61_13065 [Proteobacteria bacterium]|nr:hypothetical protein [Pseudomonadota bacterium]
MGTSGSSKGPKNSSPLVPPGVDDEPGKPLPEPEGQRFRGFRTEFGRAVAGGGTANLTSALGKYAREATLGSAVGPRRFGAAYSSGAALADTLSNIAAGGTGQAPSGVDLSGLVGQPVNIAAQEIARALAPDNIDADSITAAIQEAITEVLPEAGVFDPSLLTPDALVHIMVEFFSRILFIEITNVAGDAWNHAPDAAHATQTEAALLELIRVVVDKHFGPRIAQGLNGATREEFHKLERAAMNEVWREWEDQA